MNVRQLIRQLSGYNQEATVAIIVGKNVTTEVTRVEPTYVDPGGHQPESHVIITTEELWQRAHEKSRHD